MDLLEVDRILACVGPSFENQDLRFFLLREGNSSVGVKSTARNSGRVKLTESALVLSVGQIVDGCDKMENLFSLIWNIWEISRGPRIFRMLPMDAVTGGIGWLAQVVQARLLSAPLATVRC